MSKPKAMAINRLNVSRGLAWALGPLTGHRQDGSVPGARVPVPPPPP